MTKTIVGTISAIVVILGTAFAVSSKYVTHTEYTGSMQSIEKRLDRIEHKLDRAIERDR